MGVERPGGEIPVIFVIIPCGSCCFITHPQVHSAAGLLAHRGCWHWRPARPFLPCGVTCPSGLHTDVGEWPRAWGSEGSGVPVPRVQQGLRIGQSGSQQGPQFLTKRGDKGEQWLSWGAASGWPPPSLSPPLPGRPPRGPFKRPARLRQPPRPPPPGPPLPAAPSAGRAGVRPERAGRSAALGKEAAAGTRAARERVERSALAAAMG